LIVIGAGMAGASAANKCASAGWKVAIVDALPYGGTCALRGCDPKKILRRGAEIIDSARMMRGKGIDDEGLCVNWGDLMKHKHGTHGCLAQAVARNAGGAQFSRSRARANRPETYLSSTWPAPLSAYRRTPLRHAL